MAGLPERRLAAAVLALAALYAAAFSRLAMLFHAQYNTAAYDLGTFDQGIWLAGHSTDLFVTVRGLHLLGDHVRLFAFVLAPLYWVWDDVRALLVAQTLVIATGSWLVWRISRRLAPAQPWMGLALAVSWLLNPAVQNLNLDHAHPDAFAQTLVLASVLALLEGRRLAFWLAAALAMSCKEDVPLVFVGLGLAWALWGGSPGEGAHEDPLRAAHEGRPDGEHGVVRRGMRKDVRSTRRQGLLIAGVAAAVFATFLLVVLPTFNDVGFFRYGKKGFLTTFWYHGLDPAWLLGRLFQPGAFLYLAQLALPLAALFAWKPAWLVPALPALFVNLVSDGHYMRGVEHHYQTSIVPFLYVAAASAVAGPRLPDALRRALPAAVVLGAVAANVLWSRFPLSKPGFLGDMAAVVERAPHVRKLDALVAMIPPDAVVAADYSTVPHLTHRRRVYMLPNPYVAALWGVDNEDPHDPDTVEYVLARNVPGPEQVMKLALALEAEGRLDLVAGDDVARLFRRGRRLEEIACGDANLDQKVEAADAAFLASAAVSGGRCPMPACDVDGDGVLRQSDAQHLLRFLDRGAPPLACPPAIARR